MKMQCTREPLPGDLPGSVQFEVTRRRVNGYAAIDLYTCDYNLTEGAQASLRATLDAIAEEVIAMKKGGPLSYSAGRTYSAMCGVPAVLTDRVLDAFRSVLADARNLEPLRDAIEAAKPEALLT